MTRDALKSEIHRFMVTSLERSPHQSFEALALKLHQWQRDNSPVVAALSPSAVTRWEEIPAIPVGVYKTLPVGTVGEDEAAVIFRTSGTTGGGRGVHRIRDTELYDFGALNWAKAQIGAFPTTVIALLNDPAKHPDSSLAHMVALFPQGVGKASWHLHNGVLNHASLNQEVRGSSGPVFLCATAFALAEWLENDPQQLPPGSVLMVTGGFKGRSVTLSDTEMYALAQEQLRPSKLVTEYGMTELSSQLWGSPTGAYRPPPWLKVLAVDPVSGAPLPPGEAGQLRFFDLANLDSSLGIETMDLGLVHPDGSVSLRGRLEGAPARGCSLTVEEAWSRGNVP